MSLIRVVRIRLSRLLGHLSEMEMTKKNLKNLVLKQEAIGKRAGNNFVCVTVLFMCSGTVIVLQYSRQIYI